MSADLLSTEQNDPSQQSIAADAPGPSSGLTQPDANTEENDEDDEEEEEPKLKYAKLTGSLTNVYRNGDSTSAFTVAGDKIVLGTHNGNIHVLSLPTLKSLKTYHAHGATITSVSVSPTPPPPSVLPPRATEKGSGTSTGLRSPPASVQNAQGTTTSSPRTPRSQQPSTIPNTPSNNIYIATASLDGHVCISSLLDPKDVQLRNFARPVQAVALSPDYRSDRTYVSGGLAGQLILTVGGKPGVTVDANTNSSAAAATSGFLGAFGLSADRGKDTVLHSGEGAISCIRWSLSRKWVAWVNEEGIKVMRSHLRLGSEDEDDAWKRIAHERRPRTKAWEEMVGVWKGKAEWVDDRKLELDEDEDDIGAKMNGTNGTTAEKSQPKGRRTEVEKLVVGWGNSAWIFHVTEGAPSTSQPANGGKRVIGTVERMHRLDFTDCIVSGLSLYTPCLMAILAYRTHDDDNRPIQQPNSTATNGTSKSTRKGRHNRQTGLAPQLRLINLKTGTVGLEEQVDELSISRFETLSAQDYHFGTLFVPPPTPKEQQAAEKGALEGIWDSTRNATRLFSSNASVLSSQSSEGQSTVDNGGKAFVASPGSSAVGVPLPLPAGRRIGIADAHPFAASPGLKLFIQSPYDCILAVRTDLRDRLEFLLDQRDYASAWHLVDKHPEIVEASIATTRQGEVTSPISTPSQANGGGSLADFFADDTASQRSGGGLGSVAQNEKRRIGELWLQRLVSADLWAEAGEVTKKVLGKSRRWEHWVLAFAEADKFDEITPYIPLDAHLPGLIYEIVLGHYITTSLPRFHELLEIWDPETDLYDVASVRTAVERRLESEDVEEGSDDWRILMEALAKLYLANGRTREALRCYFQTQNAEKAMELIREDNLIDGIGAEDVPWLLMLKISKEQMRSAPLDELEEASSEAIKLLAGEAMKGSLMPATVIAELEDQGRAYRPFIYFYLRALWYGAEEQQQERRMRFTQRREEGHALVEDHADLAVELFVEYDRGLLQTFLRASEVYSYDKAIALCEQRGYIPELVDVLSKTGQTKRALFLIIGELGDVKRAIDLAKANPDLWDDLIAYSMDKPSFIRGLLEEVGTAFDSVEIVRRIPEGLEIEGLRQGIRRLMREYDIQFSISEGVARVLRGEVGMGMDTLRAGQRKGVRFEVVREPPKEVGVSVVNPPTKIEGGALPVQNKKVETNAAKQIKPGHCVGCDIVFDEDEKEPLIGFACGHVYHLSCLLKLNPQTSDEKMIARLLDQLGAGNTANGDDGGYSGRSVGAKVAHAHIIKNVLRGGCQRCNIVHAG